jgi:signal recognition particle GTPase
MTQARWIFIILCFLLPAATDLLFHNVSVCWLIGCTVIVMIWNFFCGCEILDLVFCLFPGMIVWLLARFSKGIGMGDVLSIIEKAEEAFDLEEAEKIEKQLKKREFDLDDYLVQLRQVKKMGSFSSILKMIPGMGQIKNLKVDDNEFNRIEAIICSMTAKERRNPKLLNGSRRLRIAKGSGTTVQEINKFMQTFETTQKMMKKLQTDKGSMKKLMKGINPEDLKNLKF